MRVARQECREGVAHEIPWAWPPTRGRQTARKPAGGFIDCPIDVLTLPWWVYQQGSMDLGTLRAWLGTLELREKRCTVSPGTPVHYSLEELRRLLRVPRLAPVTVAVQRLEVLGLLAWSSEGIQVLPQANVLREALGQESYQTLRAQCPPGQRWVPAPRRLLRWLAQEGQAGLIATALGVLLRCLRYKARQCVAGGRVAAPWVAQVFGVAERTVQRAFTTLEACGWLARLAVQPARERPHGRYTVVNLMWQQPGATERSQKACAATAAPEEPTPAPCQKMSPIEGGACQKMSPIAAQHMPLTSGNTAPCGTSTVSALSQPFQEEGQDPEPAERRPTGASTHIRPDGKTSQPSCIVHPADEGVTENEYAAAVARLKAEGTDPAFLIRPVVLAEIQRARQETLPRAATAPEVPDASTVLCRATAPCPATQQRLQAPTSASPACAGPPSPLPPPTLHNVTLEDLRDVGRLLALHQEARARGWLRGGEAAQLTIVAAAVHARRVGEEPCRLFVALLRDQRWEVITQEDEDQALAMLRAYRDGPCRRSTGLTAAPEVPLPDDARFVLLAEQVLRQAGWRSDPFLAVAMQYPTWTRTRWDQAHAALEQWRQQQAQACWQMCGLEGLVEDVEHTEANADA
jgi:hypothetical protein